MARLIQNATSNIANRTNGIGKYASPAVYTNTSNDTFKSLLNAAHIYDRSEIEWYTKFNRFGCLDPYNTLTTTREYIFMTKPDLHIFANSNTTSVLNPELEKYPIWEDALVRYNDVLQQLQYSVNGQDKPFINLFTNSIKSSVDLPDISTTDVQTSENVYGTYMTYRRSSITSDEQHEFSIEFEDTKYTEVYMWFKLYDEYEKLKDLGAVTPPNELYIINKIIHDQMALFKFIVGEDGETLIYWAKMWGVYPKGVPRNAFSDLSSGDSLKISVSFKAQFVDDMDPNILVDFNRLTIPNGLPSIKKILPIYDKSIGRVSGEWAGNPFITKTNNAKLGIDQYKFKWMRA